MSVKVQPKFKTGSLFICSKCGQSFDEPAPDRAEVLKTQIRETLKNENLASEVRVMVGSCLGVCQKPQLAYVYYPLQGETELFVTSQILEESKTDILATVKSKLK